MDYDDFAERFLIALHFETETSPKQYFRAGELIEKYALKPRSNWISRIADDWEGSYFRDVSKVLNGYDDWSFRISAGGSRKVESEFSDLEEIREFLDVARTNVVDSTTWTGLPSQFVLNEERKAELSTLLTKAERDLDDLGAGNSEKAMARAYIVAAKVLADAPEPPVDIIWDIIGRANNLSGIASLFVSIIALFQTAIH
ncbi:hypothetical protein PMI04_008635 [Sphingobium sp. AP49]|uniref:hypothetical protein n=1 Tax=Sphingobium sp. AP49 TaxID=1144307 RepID=UPI00026ED3D1|nr:hypothetical protein [Sphingobium sp. AP49]WHO40637.1 hypothetical protein PMI04_008635 [Sphingobium sp. AP49]